MEVHRHSQKKLRQKRVCDSMTSCVTIPEIISGKEAKASWQGAEVGIYTLLANGNYPPECFGHCLVQIIFPLLCSPVRLCSASLIIWARASKRGVDLDTYSAYQKPLGLGSLPICRSAAQTHQFSRISQIHVNSTMHIHFSRNLQPGSCCLSPFLFKKKFHPFN